MSKLHIPGTGQARTACERQLNNHRSDRAQDASGAAVAASQAEYLEALHKGKACRHCGRAAGLIPPIHRAARDEDGDEYDDTYDESVARRSSDA